MEAKLVDDLPTGKQWQYEPKWDGFRCLAIRDGEKVDLMSKAGKPLARYFPDVVALLVDAKGKSLAGLTLDERRDALEAFMKAAVPAKNPRLRLSPATSSMATVTK